MAPYLLDEEEEQQQLLPDPSLQPPTQVEPTPDLHSQLGQLKQQRDQIRKLEQKRLQPERRGYQEKLQMMREEQASIRALEQEDFRLDDILDANPSSVAVDSKYDAQTRWAAAVRANKELYEQASWGEYIARTATPVARDVVAAKELSEGMMAAMRIRDGKAKRDDYMLAARSTGEAAARGDWSTTQKFGDAVLGLVPLFAELGLTGGVYTATKGLAVKGLTKGAKEVSKEVAEGAAKKAVEMSLKKKLGAHAAGAVAGGAAIAAVNPQTVVKYNVEKGLTDVLLSDKFQVSLATNGEINDVAKNNDHKGEFLNAFMHNFPSAFGKSAAELGSEMMGGDLAKVGGLMMSSALVKKLSASPLGRSFLNASDSTKDWMLSKPILNHLARKGDGSPLRQQLMDVSERIGLHGIVGELSEEMLNDVLGMTSVAAEKVTGAPIGFGEGELGGGTTGKGLKAMGTLDPEMAAEAAKEMIFMAAVLSVPMAVRGGVGAALDVAHDTRQEELFRMADEYRTATNDEGAGNEEAVAEIVKTFSSDEGKGSDIGEVPRWRQAESVSGTPLPKLPKRQRAMFAQALFALEQRDASVNESFAAGKVVNAKVVEESGIPVPEGWTIIGDNYAPPGTAEAVGEPPVAPEAPVTGVPEEITPDVEETILPEEVVPVAEEPAATPAAEMFTPSSYENIEGYKSRSKIVDMDIDDFLRMARTATEADRFPEAENVLAAGNQFRELPFLTVKSEGMESHVIGHEGRNRAEALKRRGYTRMPVVITDTSIRWDQQGESSKFDYKSVLPTTLYSEAPGAFEKVSDEELEAFEPESIPFPVTRETASVPYSQPAAEEPAAAGIESYLEKDMPENYKNILAKQTKESLLVEAHRRMEGGAHAGLLKSHMEDLLAGNLPPENSNIRVYEDRLQARLILEQMEDAATVDSVLYRGDRPVTAGVDYTQVEPGDVVKVKGKTLISGITTDKKTARKFMKGTQSSLDRKRPGIIWKILPGAKALPLQSRSLGLKENEHLALGQFRVVSKKKLKTHWLIEVEHVPPTPAAAPVVEEPAAPASEDPDVNDLASRIAAGEKLTGARDVAKYTLLKEEVDAQVEEYRAVHQPGPQPFPREQKRAPGPPVNKAVIDRLTEMLPFATAKTTQYAEKEGVRVDLGGDRWITIENTDDMEIDINRVRELYPESDVSDEDIRKAEILGAWLINKGDGTTDSGLGILKLKRDLDREGAEEMEVTLWHELVHTARSLGLWTDNQWKALEDKYVDKKIHDTDLRQEEAIADGVGATMVQRKNLIRRIKKFLRKILASILPGRYSEPSADLAEELLTERSFWQRKDGARVDDTGLRYSVKFRSRAASDQKLLEANARYMELAQDEEANAEELQRMVDAVAERSTALTFDSEGGPSSETTAYSVRRTSPPENTETRYKAFRIVGGHLRPLYASTEDNIPMGVWLDAKEGGETFVAENGRRYIRSKKLGRLRYRPGWHTGTLPYNPQGAGKVDAELQEGHPYKYNLYEDVVFAEVEIAADKNYEEEYMETAVYTKKGKVNENESGLQYVPEDGYYDYGTSFATRESPGNWSISGSMKINRLLTHEEASEILQEEGVAPQLQVDDGNFVRENIGSVSESSDATNLKLQTPVTRDDAGNIIPLDERFQPEEEDIRYSIRLPGEPRRGDERRENFRKWFGDSKVVDEDGEPLVLYHGTQELDYKPVEDAVDRGEQVDLDYIPDISVFRSNKEGSLNEMLGPHFAVSPEVAGVHTSRERDYEHGRILPVYLSIQKPRVIDNKGQFDETAQNSDIVAVAMEGNEEMFVYWVVRSRNIKEDAAKQIYKLLKQRKDIPKSFGVAAFKHRDDRQIDPGRGVVGDYVANWDSGLMMLSEVQRLEVVEDYKRILKSEGYDGTMYVNNAPMEKVKGEDMRSYVPFTPTQIKSATGNIGTFDPTDPDIRYSLKFPGHGRRGPFGNKRGERRAVATKVPAEGRERSPVAISDEQVVKDLRDIWDIPIVTGKFSVDERTAAYEAYVNTIYANERFAFNISAVLHEMGIALDANTDVWSPKEMDNPDEVNEELMALSWDESREGGLAEFFRQVVMGDSPVPGRIERKAYQDAQKKKARIQKSIDKMLSKPEGLTAKQERALEKKYSDLDEQDTIIEEQGDIFTRDIQARAPQAFKHFNKWMEGNNEQRKKVGDAQRVVRDYSEQWDNMRVRADRYKPGKDDEEKSTWDEWTSWHVWEPYLEWYYRMYVDKLHFPVHLEKLMRRAGLKIGGEGEPAALSDIIRYWYGKEAQHAMDAFENGVRDPLADAEDRVLYPITTDATEVAGGHGLPRALHRLDMDNIDEDKERLFDFMHAQHAYEMSVKKPGFWTGMSADQAQGILKTYGMRGELHRINGKETGRVQFKFIEGRGTKEARADAVRYGEIARMLRAYAMNLQKLKRKYGVISLRDLKNMSNTHEYYYPLNKENKGHKFLDRHVKKLDKMMKTGPGKYTFYRTSTGSDQKHVDPIVSLMMKTHDTYKAVAEHHKARTMMTLMHPGLQHKSPLPRGAVDTEGILDFFRPKDPATSAGMSLEKLEKELKGLVEGGVLSEDEQTEIYHATVLRDSVRKGQPEGVSDDARESIKKLAVIFDKRAKGRDFIKKPLSVDARRWDQLRRQMIDTAGARGVQDAYSLISTQRPTTLPRKAVLDEKEYIRYGMNIDGTRYEALVDPRLIEALHSSPMIPEHWAYRSIAMMTHWRKGGAVYLNPSFAVMDWFRNPIQYALGSRERSPFNALGAAYWWSTAMVDHNLKSKPGQPYNEVIAQFYRDSGKISAFYGELSRNEIKLNNSLNRMILNSKDPVVGFDHFSRRAKELGFSEVSMNNVIAPLKKLKDENARHAWVASFDNAKSFITMSDSVARVAEYYAVLQRHRFEMRKQDDGTQKLMKQEGGEWVLAQPSSEVRIEAALAANEAVLDFLKQGQWGEHMNKVSMFWSAGVNASDKLMRIHVESLAKTDLPGSGFSRMLTDKRRDPKRLMDFYLAGMSMSLIYWAMVHDEDWYVELPAHVKNMYWVIALPWGDYLYIAKGYDAGHVFNSVEGALNAMATEDKRAFEEMIWHTLDKNFHITPVHMLKPSTIPGRAADLLSSITVAGPGVEMIADWDFFRQSSIEGARLKDREARHRSKPSTLLVSKLIAQATGHPSWEQFAVSPVKFEHAANQWTGGMYKRYAKLVDIAAGDRPLSWRDVPGMYSIYRDRDSSRSLQYFYDKQWYKVKQAHASAKHGFIPMTSTLNDSYQINYRYSRILSAIFKEIEDIRDPKESREAGGKYAIGIAREATGEAPLEKFPTIWKGKVPPGIEKVRDKTLGTLIRNSTAPLLNRQDRKPGGPSLAEWQKKAEDRKSSIRTAIRFLRRTGLSRAEIERRMRDVGRDKDIYIDRLRSNWVRYGGG